jgi:hypothetical protein
MFLLRDPSLLGWPDLRPPHWKQVLCLLLTLLAHPSGRVRSALVDVLVLVLNDPRPEHRLELIEQHDALRVLSAFVTAASDDCFDTHTTLTLLRDLKRFYNGLSAAHVQQLGELGIVRPLLGMTFSHRQLDVRTAGKAFLAACCPAARDSFENGPPEQPPLNPAANDATAAAPPSPPANDDVVVDAPAAPPQPPPN